MLWQLYAAAFNHLSRTVDDQRLTAGATTASASGKVAAAAGSRTQGTSLLFWRISQTLSADAHSGEIVGHCRMYDRLKQKDESPRSIILRRDGYFELVLLTLDCPGLFFPRGGDACPPGA